MKKKLLVTTVLVLAAGGISCWAQVVPDPLHGYCSVGCIDNSINSPTSQNPITGFGFTVSPGSTPVPGDLVVDVLVPDNKQTAGASYHITGTVGIGSGTGTLFSATDWVSGDLATYLGISASPTNSIGAFLPSTVALVPGATGFSVYQVDLGSTTLLSSATPNVSPLMNIVAIPKGSYIVGFLTPAAGGGIIATANSGAIFETGDAPPPIPEPSSIVLLGSLTVGLATLLKRKANARA